LVQPEAADGEPRFALLETLREYARRQLAAHGETDAIRQAHADYYRALIGDEATRLGGISRPVLTGPAFTWGQVEREQENARAALGWFLERGEVERGLGLVALLWNLWHDRGLEGEARAWFARFLARPEAAEPAARKAVCWAAGMVAWTRNDATTAQAHFAEGLALARAGGDKLDTAWFLNYLALATRERGEDEAAEALLRESLTLERDGGDAGAIRVRLVYLGDSARLRGDDAAARSLYEESLLTHPANPSWEQRNLAYLALHAGDLPAAEALSRESLSRCREEGSTLGRTQCLVALAGIAAARGQGARAARLLGAFAAGLDRIDAALYRPERFERDRCLEEVRARLGEPAFAAAWAEGQAMTLEQAVTYALADDGSQ
jgi:non-specific serine/threonine protein kinase